ncbi:hypothetical protein [Paracandidimonas soli]|uniref:hypothetical protein n=1 Tax=Paracandidimonas soli TaxID=1917182 RepID=UPI00333E5EBB
MFYIYQILAVILIAVSVAAYAGDRRTGILIASLISVVCAAITIATHAWWPLVVGAAVYFATQAVQRDDYAATASSHSH